MPENKEKNGIGFKEILVKHRIYFIVDVLVILTITFSILYLFNLVPPEFQTLFGRAPGGDTAVTSTGELPLSVQIPEVGVDTQVYNPDSTSTDILDSWLLKGAVRWPGSGVLGEASGNILIFGHSTSYKTVINQAFKTFVGLKNLKAGDPIYIYSAGKKYTYTVTSVQMEEASQVFVNFKTTDRELTLSTCNTSIGDTSARYVVRAVFASVESL